MAQKTRLRALKKQRTRDAILDAALRLFAKKGFMATTVEDIAAEAEVAPRTFYRYFPSKEDVAFVDQDAEDRAMEKVAATRLPDESDLDFLTRGIHAVLAVGEGNLERQAAMYKVLMETPAVQARALQIMVESERKIVRALLDNRRTTRDAELRARVLAACASAAARAAFMFWLESGQKDSPRKDCDKALELLRSGFRSDTVKPARRPH
jgi:AcrR family transcriptional regulator